MTIKQIMYLKMKWCIILSFSGVLILSSCSIQWHNNTDASYTQLSYKPEKIKQQVHEMEQRRQSFTGFALYDLESNRMLVEHNSDKYFMPASETKLFTFYTSQKMIGDSIPALKYAVHGDSLLFWDPSEIALAQKSIKKTIAFKFLKSRPENLFCINAPPSSLSNAIDWGWDDYMVQALADTLKRPVPLIKRPVPKDAQVLFGLPADTVYKYMLQVNDNLLAEQLLVLCSGTLSDTLSVEGAIKHILSTDLADLPDKPVWIDGSGLSTLNMFTPRTIIALLQKLLEERPQEQLFSLLATGGNINALPSKHKSALPFIFGEAGTPAHVQNQSGYIITKRGKVLLYSFMNNNFNASPSEMRNEMVQIIAEVHEKY